MMCWFLLVFVLIFEFSSNDGGDFCVFWLVVVLVTWWGFVFGADWKVSIVSVSVRRNRGW